ATPSGTFVPGGASTAAAPFFTASSIYVRPSAFAPGKAANRLPRATLRLSGVRPEMSGSLWPRYDGHSSVRRKMFLSFLIGSMKIALQPRRHVLIGRNIHR